MPYRSWCAACVRGRGVADSHEKQTDEEKQRLLGEVGMDYDFPVHEVTGLACVDCDTGAVVPSAVAEWIMWL